MADYYKLIGSEDADVIRKWVEDKNKRIVDLKKEKSLNLETRAVLEKLEPEMAHIKINPIQTESHSKPRIMDTELDMVE